jgi:septal ring factor EnvC (AmiA/AmiB activator)
MADEEKKFTQEDVDKIVQERLARERAKYADYDQIKAELEATRASHAELRAENVTLKAEIAERDGKMKDSEMKAQKAEVARKAGLSEALADRIQGATPEEMEADALRLAEAMGPGPAVGTGTNPPTGAKRPLTRADVKKMSPDEITANWDQIKAQLKDGSLSRVQ